MNTKQIVTLLILSVLLSACNRVSLYNELSEMQANEMAAVLLTAGIDARKAPAKDKINWTITVSQQNIPRAMEVLAANGLPGAHFETLGDVFKKKGFVSSPLEEKARYLYGLSQELANTLSALDGVLSARVHIALPERDFLAEQAKPSSASVVLLIQPGAEIVDRETDVKAIVKDSIEGLDDVNKVTVKYFEAPPVSAPPTELQNSQTFEVASADLTYGAAIFAAIFFVGGSVVWLLKLPFRARRHRAMKEAARE